jgi:polygalacturonase
MNKSRLALSIFGVFCCSLAQATPRECLPEHFGGKGDASRLNTQAIQQAITQCHQLGGGSVILAPGVWLSGPLVLLDNVTLRIEKGATLKASNQQGQFVAAFIGHPPRAGEAFILANKVNNVAITGDGILDGDGQQSWWPEALKIRALVKSGNSKAFTDRFPGIPLANGAPRPWFVEFNGVTNGRIEQLHLTNSPMWNIVIRNSTNINVQKVTISNPLTSPNTDGMDIISSQHVAVSNMDIHTGDDNIAIKSGLVQGDASAAQDISIRDSTMREGHGISVGSETANGIGRVVLSHISFLNTENGLRIKSARDRGNTIGPVLADHLTMTNVSTPILVTDSYGGQSGASEDALVAAIENAPLTTLTPKINGVNIRDVTATGANWAMIFSGLPEAPLQNISLHNINIAAQHGIQARYMTGRGDNITISPRQGPVQSSGPDVSLKLNSAL